MRVVSLACSNTEIVCALGCGALLVGVDSHSDRPREVIAHLPKVGPDLSIDTGRVAALRPDLVLASLTVPGHERVIEGLARAGLPYLALEPVSLEDVYSDIRKVAGALGVPDRGEALVGRMRSSLHPVAAEERPGLLVQWWPKPVITPGCDSWVTDLIYVAGGRGVLGEAVKSRPLTDDEVRTLDPDVVILSWCGVAPEKYRPEVVYRNPAWQDVRAVVRQQVFCIPEAYLGRPGPGLIEGFRALRSVVMGLERTERRSHLTGLEQKCLRAGNDP